MSISIVTTVPFSVNGEESSGNTAETVSEETKNLNVGDIIEFGSYPQKQVTDTELISKLNAIDAPLISYGYVNSTGKINMGYADVTYKSVKYRKVFSDKPMPGRYGVNVKFIKDYISYAGEGTYKINEVYWFKYEPIQWKVLKNDSNGVTVLAERNLDTSMYNRISYAQSWYESYLRNWLNGKFYSVAFSNEEKSLINSTKHYNPVNQNTNYDYDFVVDKLRIPTKSEYDSFTVDNKPTTDYAKCNGYNNNSWINSINGDGFIADYEVENQSNNYYYYNYPDTYGIGVRPVMNLSNNTKVNVVSKGQTTEKKKYCSGDYVYTLNVDNEASLVEYVGEEETVTLPETLDGKTVVDISEDILKNNNSVKKITVPDSYKEISCTFKSKTLETVHIGSSVANIYKLAFAFAPNMKNVFVSENNSTYRDIDGVLCKDDAIVYYPIGRTEKSYSIPDGINKLTSGSFLNATNLEKLYCYYHYKFQVDDSEKSLGYLRKDTYDYNDVTRNTNLVIYGDHGSTIHKYANSNNIPFVDMDNEKTYTPNRLYDLFDITGGSDGNATIQKVYMNYLAEMPTLNIPSEIYGYKIDSIYCGAFRYYRDDKIRFYNISKIIIPNGVKEIYKDTFSKDTYLKEIEFADDLTNIEVNAFSGCTNLKKISKLNNVTKINDYAFNNCRSLEEVNIPDGVTSIGNNAFYNCKSLKEINLPDTVSTIGNYAFAGCESVEKFNIPKKVTELSKGLFKGCKSLKSMNIDENITSIGDELFTDCSSLEEVYIPYTIDKINNSIFDNCSSLGGIYVDSNNQSYTDLNGILVNKEKTKLILYPEGRTSKTYTVPVGITSFEDSAFAKANNLEKVIFQNGVESLSNEIFYNNTGIKTIEFSDSIGAIGERAFSGCTNLKKITIPDSVTQLGESIFSNCTSLKKVVVPYSVTELPKEAFCNCSSLDDITLENIEIINTFAFRGTPIKSFTIESSVENIRIYAFADCTNLKKVTFLSKDVYIDDKAFGYVYNTKKELFLRQGEMDIIGYRWSTAEKYANRDLDFSYYDINVVSSTTTTPTVVKPTKLTLNKKRVVLTKYSRNTGTKLNATVTPTNATNKSVIWKSSNSKVAKVDSKGNVTTVSKGSCIITAISTVDSKVKATCKVTVVQKVVSVKLSAKSKTIKKGKSFTLKATVLPTNANMKSVTFTSTNKKVATVNSKGKVTAKKVGKATIIVTTKDGKKMAKCTLKVK